MLPFEDDNGGKLSYTLNGTLYPDEQVVIYDIGDVKPETEKKRRGRTKRELRIIFEDLVVAPTCDSKETLSCRWELFNCEKGYLPDKPDESLPDF